MDDLNDLVGNPSSRRMAGGAGQAELDGDDRKFVYAVARRFVRCANDADDVTQDAMLLAFRHRASFRGEAKYRTWLYRIAATTAISFLRRRKRSREQLGDGTVETALADDAKSPETQLVDRDADRFVRRAIARLDPKYRDVLLWRAEATDSETAAHLGISLANVKVRAFRAREQLRGALAQVR